MSFVKTQIEKAKHRVSNAGSNTGSVLVNNCLTWFGW